MTLTERAYETHLRAGRFGLALLALHHAESQEGLDRDVAFFAAIDVFSAARAAGEYGWAQCAIESATEFCATEDVSALFGVTADGAPRFRPDLGVAP